VQPSSPATPHFSCDLLALTGLTKLQRLELSCSHRIALPLTPRVVSLAALAWPRLSTLALSVMGGRELVPEALQLLDSLTALRSLSLVSPLASSEAPEEVDPGPCVPVNLRYLPRGLLHLRLERAEVSAAPACAQLPALSSLSLHHGRVDDRTLMHMAAGVPGLRSLDLNRMEDLSEPGLMAVLGGLTKLERLTVAGSSWNAEERPPTQGRRLSRLAAALTASAQSLQHLVWQPDWGSLSEEQLLQGARAFCDFRALRVLCISSAVSCSQDQDQDQGQQKQKLTAALKKLRLGLPNSVLPLCTMTTKCSVRYDIFNDVQVEHIGGA
jgi:hypothetical protein